MAFGPSDLTGALGMADRSDPKVIGTIAPDAQALALLDLCDEIWGKEGPPARLVGHIKPERVTMSRANHRASDGPASRSPTSPASDSNDL